jgi:hypothetical protein
MRDGLRVSMICRSTVMRCRFKARMTVRGTPGVTERADVSTGGMPPKWR